MEKLILTTAEKLMRADQFAKVVSKKMVIPRMPLSQPIELKKVVTQSPVIEIPVKEIANVVNTQIPPKAVATSPTQIVVPTNSSTQIAKGSNANFWWALGIGTVVVVGGIYLYHNGYFSSNKPIRKPED
jgi:hypothetical protein